MPMRTYPLEYHFSVATYAIATQRSQSLITCVTLQRINNNTNSKGRVLMLHTGISLTLIRILLARCLTLLNLIMTHINTTSRLHQYIRHVLRRQRATHLSTNRRSLLRSKQIASLLHTSNHKRYIRSINHSNLSTCNSLAKVRYFNHSNHNNHNSLHTNNIINNLWTQPKLMATSINHIIKLLHSVFIRNHLLCEHNPFNNSQSCNHNNLLQRATNQLLLCINKDSANVLTCARQLIMIYQIALNQWKHNHLNLMYL
mmetsp:Transcript_1472/g.1659  ORF Transcript_1472/g.1659 Transcript_1472/m.1659 type:complete len:257 (-) Transcript_1472:1156-1926(-)